MIKQLYAAADMSLRDYFIAHAPAEPWSWFRPNTPPAPAMPKSENDPSWEFTEEEHHAAQGWRQDAIYDLTGSPRLDSFASQWKAYWKAFNEWNQVREQQRFIQWPAFWADQMLAQRGKGGE